MYVYISNKEIDMETYITKTEAETVLEALKLMDPFCNRVREIRNVSMKMNQVIQYAESGYTGFYVNPVTGEVPFVD
jgi:hypothetical protein